MAEPTDTGDLRLADLKWMRRALQLAREGEGHVEPNPMVGCVLTRDDELVGEGWHRKFGGPHAEIEALRDAKQAGRDPRGSTAYVTLEPCCHHGKTPPCSQALIDAGVARVVIAMRDPFPKVNGGGVAQLTAAGIEVEVGLCEQEAEQLNAPYLCRLQLQRPWVIAKWAMSLDGKIATRTGDSQWISGEASRREVHALRGRVDSILVGVGTALADNPLLTARPAGPRTACRVVCDGQLRLPLDYQLVQTAPEPPTLIACSEDADRGRGTALQQLGVEVWRGPNDREQRLRELLAELGRREFTNVMVEGGGQLLGALAAASLIDEAHVYVAPLLIGGADAPTPLGDPGAERLVDAARLEVVSREPFGDDIRIIARR